MARAQSLREMLSNSCGGRGSWPRSNAAWFKDVRRPKPIGSVRASGQRPVGERPNGRALPLLDWRPLVVDSRIDWSPGADWAVDDRVKWDNGEAAVFPASDTEPPREWLQTDADPDPSGDNPWAGGMYLDDGTLTLDGSIPATPADSITIESGGTLEIIEDGLTAQLNDSPPPLPFARVATRGATPGCETLAADGCRRPGPPAGIPGLFAGGIQRIRGDG